MMENTPTWMSWRGMKHRCFRKKDNAFQFYGARGIRVCSFLMKTPLNLVREIGLRPLGKTIDRINTRLHYSCGHCSECKKYGWSKNIRWSTPKEQCRNRIREAKAALINGKKMFLSDIAKAAGTTYKTILVRFNSGVRGNRLIAPPSPTRVKYRIGKESMTIRKWSDRTGISINTLKTRTGKGIRGAALIEVPRKTGRHANQNAD